MTGWTWEHVANTVTLPQVQVLSAYWRQQPPMVVLAGRLCRYFGIEVSLPQQRAARSAEEAIREAVAAGLPVSEGRPDDPMLDFLDL